jgi:hypothetical protein
MKYSARTKRVGFPILFLSVLSAASSILLFSAARADAPYWRVTVDRVTVIANGNARRCNRFALQFIAFERILRDLANLDPDYEPLPIRIYSLNVNDAYRYFYTEAEIRKQRAEESVIFSKYRPDGDFILAAIVDEGGIEEPWQSIMLMHAQSTLTYGPTRRYPMWFQLGVANVLNGMIVNNDGSVLLSRDEQFEATVEKEKFRRAKYDLASLLQANAQNFPADGDIRAFMTRAREWALFGLLTTAERRERFLQLATLMRQGTPADEAVNESFGISLADLSVQFEDRRWRKEVKYRLPVPADLPQIPAATPLDAAEAKLLLNELSNRAKQ